MYLLDTNVLSELRKPRPHGAVLAWVRDTDPALVRLSAVTLGEIQAGIELTREQDEAKAEAIERWLAAAIDAFDILPVDAPVFRAWARLMLRRSDTLLLDALIAATALVNRLTVVTRNTRDFEALQVPVFNPFEYQARPASDRP